MDFRFIASSGSACALRWLNSCASCRRSAGRPAPVRPLTNTRGTWTPSSSNRSLACSGCWLGSSSVDLVEHQHLRHVGRADLVQHALHLGDLLRVVGIGGIHHVQQQVGIGRFLQGGLEGVDQAVRQVADEPHRVGQRHRAAGLAKVELARGGVERGEQLVGGIRAGLDQAR